MKKYSLLIFLATMISFWSCESLDVDPKVNDVILPDFNKIEDLQKSLDGVYSGLKAQGAYTGFVMALGEWPADNLKISSENTGQGAIIHEWDYEQGDQSVEATWIALYGTIRRANFVILNSENFQADNKASADQFKAEALIIRGLVHYELSKIFGQGESGLAVPFITDPVDIFQKQARLSRADVFQKIKDDLNTAIQLMTTSGASFNVNRVSKPLAYGLLARIAMDEKNYSEVISNADKAIEFGPELSTIETYPMMFGENDEAGEAIFKLTLNPDDQGLNDPYYADGVGARFEPTTDLLDLYDAADVRLTTNFGDINGKLAIVKFRGAPSNRDFHEPFIMRMSEIYLLRAEAKAASGDDVAAVRNLDQVRVNRIDGYVSIGETGDALVQAIRTERRKELAYEGFRFFDLRRWGMAVNRNDCTSDECVLEASNFRFIYPIPRAEIFANENMEQNSGY
ncbi:MAG TPA: RagB/SusD family nutrient uptake outer membrane protein [Bacteroidetes bacterium]|nr:RagB/SusD family nutrient uptake outer membrane protein [Bacteroidota bacterium]